MEYHGPVNEGRIFGNKTLCLKFLWQKCFWISIPSPIKALCLNTDFSHWKRELEIMWHHQN